MALLLCFVLVMGGRAGFGIAGLGRWPGSPPTRQSQPDLLEGNWIGTWASNQRDMNGALRCRVVKLSDGAYEAKFEAIFAKYFTHESTVTLRVGSRNPAWECAGEKDLGSLNGGVYKYRGHSDGSEFVCDYDSAFDKGTFRLHRATATTHPTGQ